MVEAAQQQQGSLENGEPLLQSRRLSCDASRKGLPWISSASMIEVKSQVKDEETPKKDRRPSQKIITVKKGSSSNDKRVHIVATKKAQFSHILPDQRDSCIHNSPIIYPQKGEKQSRREVAALWYHPFQAGD